MGTQLFKVLVWLVVMGGVVCLPMYSKPAVAAPERGHQHSLNSTPTLGIDMSFTPTRTATVGATNATPTRTPSPVATPVRPRIDKLVSPSSAQIGLDAVTFTLRLRNTTNGSITVVSMRDYLPRGFSALACTRAVDSGPQTSCPLPVFNTDPVTWSGSIQLASQETLHFYITGIFYALGGAEPGQACNSSYQFSVTNYGVMFGQEACLTLVD